MAHNEFQSALDSFMRGPFTHRQRDAQFARRLGRDAASRLPDLEDTSADVELVSNFVSGIFRGVPANPNKSEIVRHHDVTFDPLAVTFRNGSPTTYNAFVSELEAALASERHVALVGQRGLGKTACINQWLNQRHFAYFEQLRSTWFRVDITKIYDLLARPQYDKGNISLINYFKVHSLYVFLTYSGLIKNNDERGVSQLFAGIVGERLESLELLADEISSRGDKLSSDDPYSESVVASFFEHSRAEWKLIDLAWDELQGALNRRARFVVCIVDGIDNMSWTRGSDEYDFICKQVQILIDDGDKQLNLPNLRFLLVTRPETIPELSITLAPYGYNGVNNAETRRPVHFVTFELTSPDIDRVLDRKAIAVSTSNIFDTKRKALLESLREHPGSEPARSTVTGIGDTTRTYLTAIGSEVARLVELSGGKSSYPEIANELPYLGGSARSVFVEMFASNTRALLDCLLLSLRGRNHAQNLGIAGSSHPRRNLEFAMLAGKVYLSSEPTGRQRYQKIPRGAVFPNIYWYQTSGVPPTRWHGLCGVRLLQLLRVRHLSAADAIEFLVDWFGYSRHVVEEHVEAFVAFGLIEVDYYSGIVPMYCSDENLSRRYRSVVSTTKKGNILLSLSMCYHDYMYFLSLDTPLHEEFVRGDAFMREYRNPSNVREAYYNFFDAMIPSVAVLLKHINYYHHEELRRIDELIETRDAKYDGLVFNWNYLKEFFSLPDLFVDNAARLLSLAAESRIAKAIPDDRSRVRDDFDILINRLRRGSV